MGDAANLRLGRLQRQHRNRKRKQGCTTPARTRRTPRSAAQIGLRPPAGIERSNARASRPALAARPRPGVVRGGRGFTAEFAVSANDRVCPPIFEPPGQMRPNPDIAAGPDSGASRRKSTAYARSARAQSGPNPAFFRNPDIRGHFRTGKDQKGPQYLREASGAKRGDARSIGAGGALQNLDKVSAELSDGESCAAALVRRSRVIGTLSSPAARSTVARPAPA